MMRKREAVVNGNFCPARGERTFIKLLPKIGHVVVEPRRERATIDKNVATLRPGLIRQIDFGVGATPVILLCESPRHLSGNPFQPTEAAFQEVQHLSMDVVPLIPNDDTRELVVHRDIADAGHLRSGK